MVVIAGFGNPLLDLTVTVTNDTLLQKYSIKANEQREISATQMKNLIEDIKEFNPVLTPGGSVQNTLRVIQWLLEKPHATIMYGTTGCDEQAETLKNLVESEDVETRYKQKSDIPTGISIALVNGEIRTLIAHIGAAQYVRITDFQSNEFLDSVDLVYMEAFFLPLRVSAARYIRETSEEKKIPFVFNLSAIYMASMFTRDVSYFAEKCDILIGHYNEYDALIKALRLPADYDVESFAIKLSKAYTNSKGLRYGKICVITNGPQHVSCVYNGTRIETQEVASLDRGNLVDTTGAGDAFAAGFLCGFLKQQTPRKCLKWGRMVASEIVQQTGCTIPPNKSDILQSMCCI